MIQTITLRHINGFGHQRRSYVRSMEGQLWTAHRTRDPVLCVSVRGLIEPSFKRAKTMTIHGVKRL